MLWQDLQDTLKPLVERHERECAARTEAAQQRAEAAEIVLRTVRTEMARLQERLAALSVEPGDADRAAEAAVALYHLADGSEAMLVANYLRSRGWRELPGGWSSPGGGGPLPFHTAVRLQVGQELVAVRQRVRHMLADAARRADEPPLGHARPGGALNLSGDPVPMAMSHAEIDPTAGRMPSMARECVVAAGAD